MAIPVDIMEINKCCNNLECDSNIERRKNAEKLKSLLQKVSIQTWFETEGYLNKTINYTVVFKSVQGYLFKETQLIRSTITTNSLSTSSEQKLKILINHLHFVVKVANKTFPCIKCQDFIDSVLTILTTNFYCQHFGLVYLELLENDFLIYDLYVHSILPLSYKKLVCACLEFFKASKTNHHEIAKILSAVRNIFKCIFLKCAAHHYFFFFDFIKETAEILSMSIINTMIEHYLWILFHYAIWQIDVVPDLVCDLAYRTLPFVAPLLCSNKLNEDSQIYALEYCFLQVKLHLGIGMCHPNICESSLMFDKDCWLTLVKEMFLILYQKIESLAFNHQFCKESGLAHVSVADKLCTDLMALLLHVCIKNNVYFSELSVPCASSITPSVADNSLWSYICKLFTSSCKKSLQSQVLWIDVVKTFIETFPNDLVSSDIMLCLDSVNKLMDNTNCAILKSTLSLLLNLLRVYFINRCHKLDVSFWFQLWENVKCQTLKTVNSQFSVFSFKAMSYLLEYAINNKFVLDMHCNLKLSVIWQTFGSCLKNTTFIIDFLLSCVNANSCYSESFCLNETFREDSCSTRICILKWLFGFKEVAGAHEAILHSSSQFNDVQLSIQKVPNLFVDVHFEFLTNVETIGQLVISLCCSDNNQSLKKNKEMFEKACISNVQFQVQQMSSSFLQTILELLMLSTKENKLENIFQALYSVSLTAYLSAQPGKVLNFCELYSYLILKNVCEMLLACVAEGETMLIFNHSHIFNYFAKLIILLQSNLVSEKIKLILGDLNRLVLSLIEWLLNNCKNQTDCNFPSSAYSKKNLDYSESISIGHKRRSYGNNKLVYPPKRFRSTFNQVANTMYDPEEINISPKTLIGLFNKLLMLFKELFLLKVNGIDFPEISSINAFFEKLVVSCPSHVTFFIASIKIFSDSNKILESLDMCIIVSLMKETLKVHFRNQEIFSSCLNIIPIIIRYVSYNLRDDNKSLSCLFSKITIIEKLVVDEQCSDKVVLSFIDCLAELLTQPLPLDKLDSDINTLTIIEKYSNFLLSSNLLLVKQCADSSSLLFRRDNIMCHSHFAEKILLHFKQINHKLLDFFAKLQNQSYKKLYSSFYFFKTLWTVLPYSGHESSLIFETCCFISKAKQFFSLDNYSNLQFILKSYFDRIRSDKLVSVNCSLYCHLDYVMWNWQNINDLNNFPFYFFGFSSLSLFLHKRKDVVLPIIILRSMIQNSNFESLINCFQDIDLPKVIVYLVGWFLVSYEKNKPKKCLSFEKVESLLVTLHNRSKSSFSLSNIIQNGIPFLIVKLLNYFCPNNQMSNAMQFTLSENTLKYSLVSVLEFCKTGKFHQTSKPLSINSIINFFQTHSYAIHSFVLHLRDSLESSGLDKQQHLIAIHRIFISILSNSSCHYFSLFLKLTLFSIYKQIYHIAKSFLQTTNELEAQQIIKTLTYYFDLIHWLQKEELGIKSNLLFNNDITFELSCILSFVANAVFKQESKFFCENLSQTLRNIITCLHTKCQVPLSIFVLHSSHGLKLIYNEKNFLQHFSTTEIKLPEFLFDLLLKTSSIINFYPDIISLVGDMFKQFAITFLHEPIKLNLHDYKKLFKQFFSFAKCEINIQTKCAFLDCMEYFHSNITNEMNSVINENIFEMLQNGIEVVGNISMKERFETAVVAHCCIINLMQSKTFNLLFKKVLKISNDNITHQFLTMYEKIPNNAAVSLTLTSLTLGSQSTSNLWSCEQTEFKQWICNVTSELINLCDIDFLCIMKDISMLSSSVCYFILPFIFFTLCTGKNKPVIENYISNILSSGLDASVKHKNKEVLTFSLQIIELVRIECQAFHNGERNVIPLCKILNKKINLDDCILSINPLTVAKVALMCNLPTTALFYLEIWNESVTSNTKSCFFSKTFYKQANVCPLAILHQIGLLENETGEIAIDAFNMLNESDNVYGCCSVLPHLTRFPALFESQGHWIEALEANDVNSSEKTCIQENILKCLQESGFEHVSNVYARHINNESFAQSLKELRFKSAWQSCQWDKEMFTVSSNELNTGFHRQFFNHLVNLHRDHAENFSISFAKLKCECLNSFNGNDIVYNFGNFNHMLIQLQCIKETKIVQKLFESNANVDDVIETWKQLLDSNVLTCTFQDANLLLSTHTSLLLMTEKRYSNKEALSAKIFELLAMHYLNNFKLFCQFKRFQHARHSLCCLTHIVNKIGNLEVVLEHASDWWNNQIILNKAVLFWKQQEKTFAISLLKNLLKKLNCSFEVQSKVNDKSCLLLAKVLRMLGIWMNESKYESSIVIMNDYLEKSVSLLEQQSFCSYDSYEELSSSHFALAKFADEQLQEILLYKSSQDYNYKYKLASEALEKRNDPTLSKRTSLIINKSCNIDKQELFEVEKNELKFLLSSVKSYMRCLELSNLHDLYMHRLCSLWFFYKFESKVNEFILENHCKILSYKYVSLAYQMAARLSKVDPSTGHAQLLQNILTRVASDHPYHVLPILLTLLNSCCSAEQRPIKKLSIYNQTKRFNEKEISCIINATSMKWKKLVLAITLLTKAYIELANFDASLYKSNPFKQITFSESLQIYLLCDPKSRKCIDLREVVIPVCNLPLCSNACYNTISENFLFSHFIPHFQTCGGVNLPKVVVAASLSGSLKKHLVKGKDDLRQDAVMQQVFEMVNLLLQKSHNKNLRIRTYKVVPLTPQTGLVEWCEGTIPIGVYLTGNLAQKEPGAHERLRPQDMSVISCRKKLAAASQYSVSKKLETFQEICAKLLPVFRYFFIEKFLTSSEWFYSKQNYTLSVASSSIIGYVVGLGDRHVQNILLDKKTAEVIHIDLGVAFEQGRCLPTPETVPFRLTRDIIDGMGLTGVEGLFRKQCEHTLSLLRSAFDIIIPILEVMLYDPLHDWAIPHNKAAGPAPKQKLSNSGSISINSSGTNEKTNELAERALLRVKEKLKGIENGCVLSVNGQVNMLIHQATDSFRLCQLFHGWQPYL